MTLIGRILTDFFDLIRAHLPDPRYQRRIQLSFATLRAFDISQDMLCVRSFLVQSARIS